MGINKEYVLEFFYSNILNFKEKDFFVKVNNISFGCRNDCKVEYIKYGFYRGEPPPC